MENNTYYFRCRYAFQYSVYDKDTAAYWYRIATSPYSDIAGIGKAAGIFYTKASTWAEGELKAAYDKGSALSYY